MDWFGDNLPGPFVEDGKAIWFFRSSATECMAHAWELIHWLREAGVVIEMQIAHDLQGHVRYEDPEQVAIVPVRGSGVH